MSIPAPTGAVYPLSCSVTRWMIVAMGVTKSPVSHMAHAQWPPVPVLSLFTPPAAHQSSTVAMESASPMPSAVTTRRTVRTGVMS